MKAKYDFNIDLILKNNKKPYSNEEDENDIPKQRDID
jgi:hypothetical protein